MSSPPPTSAPRVFESRLGGRVAPQRGHQAAHSDWVSGDAVDSGYVGAADLVEVAAELALCDRRRIAEQTGPPASAGHVHDVGQAEGRCRRRGALGCEQPAEGYTATRLAALEEAHGPHTHPDDSTSARVAGGIVGWVGGARQDELALVPSVVASSPHGVPHIGRELPLVEQAGHRPLQNLPRRDLRGQPVLEDCVEGHLAAGMAPTGPCLAAGARPFDHHRWRGAQSPLHLAVCDSRHVSRRCEQFCHGVDFAQA